MKSSTPARFLTATLALLLAASSLLSLLAQTTPPAPRPAAALTYPRGFAPAFTADHIDMNLTQQFRDGKPAPADPAQVACALSLTPPEGNFEQARWEAGKIANGENATFDYLLVLKAPTPVGTISIEPPNYGDNAGSRNGGELYILKESVAAAPNAADPAQWTKIEFPGIQPFQRFAVLPPNSKPRAFLYRDIRNAGASTVTHWNFHTNRLANVTALAKVYGNPNGTDPDGILRGTGWTSFATSPTRTKAPPHNAKNPAWYILSWDKPQDLTGLFFSSSATAITVYRFKGDASVNPALAPSSDWEAVDPAAVRECKHQFQWWAYFTRWVDLPPAPTRAIKIEITACDGSFAWINAIGSMINLKNAAPPVLPVRDDAPPFRIPAALAKEGQSAIVIDTADGVRVKNILAQVEVPQTAPEFAWDLRGPDGNLVAPGKYRFKSITGPLPQLVYRNTPYPNIQNFFSDRVPWLTGHSGPNGWLSDHAGNWACTSLGDRVYFGASVSEAGVTLIETDLDGKKLWGGNYFGAWVGPEALTADHAQNTIFVYATDKKVYRMNPTTRKIDQIFQAGVIENNVDRRGYFTAFAAHDNKLYISYAGGMPLLDNAAGADALDMANCTPNPDAGDLVRLLRITGRPPGRGVDPNSKQPLGSGRLFLESTYSKDPLQYSVIAFKKAAPLGSIILPHPSATEKMEISILKSDAPYPPRPATDADWTALPDQGRANRWECLTTPPNTLTRALRFKFTRPAADAASKDSWFARLDGLRLLNRRFQDLAVSAKIRVNSGTLTPAGEWDAQRKDAIGDDKPGIYLMEWDTPQKLDALAIKEIDGARAEIDIWTGPATGPIALDAAAGWKNVASYKPPRRTADYSGNDNQFARYMDGYVEFREKGELVTLTTRALRIRITEPWMDNADGGCLRHDGRSEHGVHITESYIMNLDTRRCKIYGVIPLQSLGGAPAFDPLLYERVEVRDGTTGKLLRELPTQLGWGGMAFGPDGNLYSINGNHTSIVKVNTETGASTIVVPACDPSRATVGPDGNAYVKPWAEDGSSPAVHVYSLATGKLLRTLGKPANKKAGPWDPQALAPDVNCLAVDRNLRLWYPETLSNPRRVLQFDSKTGELLKEILGHTWYGGAGTLNRYDISRAYFGATEFEIDYAKNKSRIRRLLTNAMYAGDLVAVRINKHTYLVSAPLSQNERQNTAFVYLADGEAPIRLVAAFGDANFFAPLRASAIVSLLNGKTPKDFKFIWSDRNANGKVDSDEVQFTPKAPDERSVYLAAFDSQLGCFAPDGRYQPKEFLADGTPLFERAPTPPFARSAYYKLANGNYLIMHGQFSPDSPQENYVVDPTGKKLWGYPAGSGVSGLNIPGWQPGNVSNELCVIGHEIDPGPLGEFVVTSANDGQWRIWTSDGLLAGQILLHKTDSRAQFLSMPDIKPGSRLDPLTASQEHFHGFFTKDENTGKYYIITGFTSINILEVQGLDRFTRVTTDFTVTAADLDRTRAWEAQQVRRLVENRPLALQARALDAAKNEAPKIDGQRKEWGEPSATMGNDNAHSFSLAYDDKNLYLCWTAKGLGPLSNAGGEFQRTFKTGAAVDFLLATNPAADPARTKPAAGDLRVLITMVDKKPRVVLYQPIAAAAKPAEAWRTYTPAGGESLFQRVVELPAASVALSGDKDFTLEAAIPLADLGLAPKKGLRLKCDWGFLTTGDGTQVKQRLYWANPQATGTSDEPTESRLEPQYWGQVTF